ncbi:MAG: CRISPR-associated endonuclease Cas2 [bacterium]|nr:CRISPR-associated endonuclease Cas2 [bacterium]
MKQQKNKKSKLKQGFTAAAYVLSELAENFTWVFSLKNYLEFSEYQDREKQQFLREQRQYLYYLKKRKFIEMQKIGKTLKIRLTEKGWGKALRDKIKNNKNKHKDKFCYFVIFDVPEKEREARNTLRNFLKECNFIKIQQSVWMTDKEVLKPLIQLLQHKKLEQWIRIVSGKLIASSISDFIRLATLKYSK